MRVVDGVRWARFAPVGVKLPKPERASGKVGLAYERKLVRVLKGFGYAVRAGQWIEFEDRNGKGFCQVDCLVQVLTEEGLSLVVLEAKLTYTDDAWIQLLEKYVPLLDVIEGDKGPIIPVQVCKHLVPGVSERRKVIETIADAEAGAVWHWIGANVA